MNQRTQSHYTETNTTDLHDHALDNITFIRNVMTRSTEFTGVPGWGMVIVGGLATLGSYVAALRLDARWWFNSWITIGVVSMVIGVIALRLKTSRLETSVFRGAGRRFFICFSPAMIAGMALTWVFDSNGLHHLLAPMWLMLYGVAIMNGGAFSISVVPLFGLTLFVLGLIVTPFNGAYPLGVFGYTVDDAFMIIGFGISHIGFGLVIARRYGG